MSEVNRHLLEIVRRYGTPTYAFDVRRLRAQVETLRTHLPAGIEILYSLKANASLGICDVLRDCGIGADVASAGELATAVEAGFPSERIFVAGPFKLPETLAQLRDLPEAVISVDSPSELQMLAEQRLPNPIVLRLRPDFCSQAVVAAGHESRFGFVGEDVSSCRKLVSLRVVNVIGFHVFSGSQYLSAEGIVAHLRGALAISLRAADDLGIAPALLNLGGGFGIPYAATADELDLGIIRNELAKIVDQVRPARIVLELGRYLVAQAGWYLTSVLGHQTFQGRQAVVVDGGTHQRADMCGLCLRTKASPPLVMNEGVDQSWDAMDVSGKALTPTDVLGCLSLPADVLAESSLLPRLEPGNVLAFANAGAYGMWSSPAMFHGSPLPAEVAFDGSEIQLMRERRPARSILDEQRHVNVRGHDA